jgi:hypothetical protein
MQGGRGFALRLLTPNGNRQIAALAADLARAYVYTFDTHAACLAGGSERLSLKSP